MRYSVAMVSSLGVVAQSGWKSQKLGVSLGGSDARKTEETDETRHAGGTVSFGPREPTEWAYSLPRVPGA